MDQQQLLKLLHNEIYPSQSIYVSYGIDNLQNDFAEIILDPKQKLLIFYSSSALKKYIEVRATLPIEKIVKVEFGDRTSPLSYKGSESNCLNICITYKNNDIENEILFSHVGFTERVFKKLYNDLCSYTNPYQQPTNTNGFIEL